MSDASSNGSENSYQTALIKDWINAPPTFGYQSPFAQAELRSLASQQGSEPSEKSVAKDEDVEPVDFKTPDESISISNDDEKIVPGEGVEPDCQPASPRITLTLEERLQGINDQIMLNHQAIRDAEHRRETQKKEIDQLTALCKMHEKLKSDLESETIELGKQKEWVKCQLQLVNAKSRTEAAWLLLHSCIRSLNDLEQIFAGVVIVIVAIVEVSVIWVIVHLIRSCINRYGR